MSLGILGDDFDIHGGGNDLVFPHHTNERAEALAVGRTFARHWVHNAMLNIEGQKMAKSLGNYRTVAELLDEHPLNGRAFRLLVLQTHYRKTMEVNAELMASSRAAVQRLDAMARRATVLSSAPASTGPDSQLDGPAIAAFRAAMDGSLDAHQLQAALDNLSTTAARAVAERLERRFEAAMDHDLGTPEAVAVIFDTLRRANAELDEGSADGAVFVAKVVEWADALGLEVEAVEQASDGDAAIEDLVSQRQAARDAKDWATADALREALSALGVVVEDTPAGPIWRRT